MGADMVEWYKEGFYLPDDDDEIESNYEDRFNDHLWLLDNRKWRTGTGEEMDIESMETSHMKNVVRMLRTERIKMSPSIRDMFVEMFQDIINDRRFFSQ